LHQFHRLLLHLRPLILHLPLPLLPHLLHKQ
jgi:hypothetical protein